MIEYCPPNLTGKEPEYIAAAMSENYIGSGGVFVHQFEDRVARLAKRDWAVAVDSGTAALLVSAHIIRPREDINISEHAFPAFRNVCRILGMKYKVISDNNYNHDVAVYGRGWLTIADRAPALGVGVDSRFEAMVDCYSFAANKIVTCGKGGAICGDDRALEKEIRKAIHPGVGRAGVFNVQMSNLAAAIGCAQLERLPEFQVRKYDIWKKYDAYFKEVNHLQMRSRGESRWAATLRINSPQAQNEICQRLTDFEIQYRRESWGDISLPSGTGLTIDQQDQVIAAVIG